MPGQAVKEALRKRQAPVEGGLAAVSTAAKPDATRRGGMRTRLHRPGDAVTRTGLPEAGVNDGSYRGTGPVGNQTLDKYD